MLVSQAIRLSASNGAKVFDFLRVAETYRYCFGATDRFDETWIVPGGAAGGLLELKYRAKAQIGAHTARKSRP